jgi:pyruvate dehydrogenase phosphatase
MNARRAVVALLSGIVGYGAYYTYNGNSTDSAAALTPGFSSSSTRPGDAAPTRSVLVIGAEELSTGTFVGEGPISKTTDDEGRAIVEMLTAEQSTQKLRKMEESCLVNRGTGVVRYDQVQLPSNNPIEDDHAEKIVEVPAAGASGSGSDWMFWGVFDGHSYVHQATRP